MLIESIIQRPKGTKVALRGGNYHFLPDADGRHVDEVEDEGDIATLLAIKEGYRPANGAAIIPSGEIPIIDGPFFIIRGPQDVEAFKHWARSIPSMNEEPSEFVLLVDKIAVGEANLGGYQIVPKLPFATPSQAVVATPVSEPSPPTSATNTILPTDQHQQASPGGDTGGSQAAGDGGADAVGGVGAETVDDADEEEAADDVEKTSAVLDREALAKEYDELVGHRPNGKWSAEKIAAVLAEHKAKG